MSVLELTERKAYLPFSNIGSVLHFRGLDTRTVLGGRLTLEEKTFLYSKPDARLVLLNLETTFPVFQFFNPESIRIPAFPTRLNFSKNESFFQYSQAISAFLSLVDRTDILLYFPEEQYTEIALFSMGAFFLKDHTIRPEELLDFFGKEFEREINPVQLEDLRNYLQGEYYLTYLRTKSKPKVSLQLERKLHIDNEPLPKIKQEEKELRVQLLSTESQIPYELNLSSLNRENPEITPQDTEEMISFNLTSLTPAEFTPETEEDSKDLLEDVLGMAETFDFDTLDLDEVDSPEARMETTAEAEFISLPILPKDISEDVVDLDIEDPVPEVPPLKNQTIPEEIARVPEPDPWDYLDRIETVPMSTILEEKQVLDDLSRIDPIFSRDFVPVLKRKPPKESTKTKIHENFLGLPDNW